MCYYITAVIQFVDVIYNAQLLHDMVTWKINNYCDSSKTEILEGIPSHNNPVSLPMLQSTISFKNSVLVIGINLSPKTNQFTPQLLNEAKLKMTYSKSKYSCL